MTSAHERDESRVPLCTFFFPSIIMTIGNDHCEHTAVSPLRPHYNVLSLGDLIMTHVSILL